MSRGPGQIEQRIGDLFAANRNRALSVDEIADHAFALDGKAATRAQRLSAIRAAHRVISRVLEMDDAWHKAERGSQKAERLWEAMWRIGLWTRYRSEGNRYFRLSRESWTTMTIGKGRGAKLWFHPPDAPVQIWVVQIDPHGVHWFDAEVVRVTERNVMARYAGESVRLDREALWRWWAWWRGVMFVSSRTGHIAGKLDEIWWERYGAAGGAPPSMQMPLAEAIALLGVSINYTKEDVIAAFRREVKKAHPDLGGTAEMFRKLVEARDRLLAAIGTSEPAPKTPAYYPSGSTIRYRSGPSTRRRVGQTRRLASG